MRNENRPANLFPNYNCQLLCDYYNLSLSQTPSSGDEDPVNSFPSESDRQQVLGFFEKHFPQVLSKMEDSELLLTLDSYERRGGVSWFETEDYHAFWKRWHDLRLLLDDLIDRSPLSVERLKWFRDQVLTNVHADPNRVGRGYEMTISLLDGESKPVTDWDAMGEDINMDQYQIVYHPFAGDLFTGLSLGMLAAHLNFSVVGVLTRGISLSRCAAMETPKIPKCRNIFSAENRPGPKRIYCSDRCRKRTYEHAGRNDISLSDYYASLDAD